jgi:hypothetical protein
LFWQTAHFLPNLLQNGKKNVIIEKGNPYTKKERCGKMKKFLCVVSNIFLSVLYIPLSIYWAIFGVLLIVAMDRFHIDSVGEVVFLLSAVIMLLTPIFAILGIVLSVAQRKRERYGTSFLVQLLPLTTMGLSVLILYLSMLLGA